MSGLREDAENELCRHPDGSVNWEAEAVRLDTLLIRALRTLEEVRRLMDAHEDCRFACELVQELEELLDDE